jgi:hypothetical protein
MGKFSSECGKESRFLRLNKIKRWSPRFEQLAFEKEFHFVSDEI